MVWFQTLAGTFHRKNEAQTERKTRKERGEQAMNSTVKIVGALVLLGGGAYGISRLLKTSNTAEKSSVTISGINPPKIKNGALFLSVNVAFDNPTDHTMSLKKPYLKAFYNGKEVGNSIPSDERVAIKANDRTVIKGINIQVPFLKLGAIAVSLVTGNIPKMAFDIELKTEADGIPYTDKQHFEL
jgi:hypothetical protein